MTQKQQKTLRIVYFTLISVALVAVAILLMVQCVAIYRLGDSPFTRESIAAHFAPIAVPVYVTLGLIAVGFALSPLLPAAPDSVPDRDAVALRRLQDKTDLAACPAELAKEIARQRRARNTHRTVTLVLLAVGTAVFLWYGLDLGHFPTENINAAMVSAMTVLLPCVGVPFLYGVFAAYFSRHSIKKETALLRTAPGEAVSPAPKAQPKSEKWMPYAQSVLVAVGVGLVVYGLLGNGAVDVLWKAVNICQECIGLG